METEGSNISRAWAQAFIKVAEAPGKKITAFSVIANVPENEDEWEDKEIRNLIDTKLKTIKNLQSKPVNTVANTIFPLSIWNRSKPAKDFFEKYGAIYPNLKKSCRENHHGLYFGRMMAYNNGKESINQLAFVLKAWRKLNRRSAFQVSVFDPREDHRLSPYLVFPCLQHVTFVPLGPRGINGLEISAYYAVQYMFEKAYGNYLGLCRLGKFMAQYMNLKFVRLSCFISTAEIGDHINGDERNKIATELKRILKK